MQRSQTVDEHALVRAAQTDAQAFGALYDRYVQRVYRYCYYRTISAPDAEDLTAQIFLATLEALPRYRQDGHFAAWLFSIARKKVSDFHVAGPFTYGWALEGYSPAGVKTFVVSNVAVMLNGTWQTTWQPSGQ